MSETTTTPEGPKAATLAELKDNLPGASTDFLVDQLEQNATLQQATKAYLKLQSEQHAELEQAKAEAEEKAEKLEAEKAKMASNPPAPKRRGNAPVQQNAEDEGAENIDYRQMATDYAKEHKCRWSEACLEIKKRHPESRGYFGAPPKFND